ncbi:hypothetical protein ACFQ0M_27285 [Kitasatospora aburaviensis]
MTQVSVLAVLALSVNNSFGFYTSWDDLFSPGGAKLALTSNENHHGGTPVSDAPIQPTDEGDLESITDLPKGPRRRSARSNRSGSPGRRPASPTRCSSTCRRSTSTRSSPWSASPCCWRSPATPAPPSTW